MDPITSSGGATTSGMMGSDLQDLSSNTTGNTSNTATADVLAAAAAAASVTPEEAANAVSDKILKSILFKNVLENPSDTKNLHGLPPVFFVVVRVILSYFRTNTHVKFYSL